MTKAEGRAVAHEQAYKSIARFVFGSWRGWLLAFVPVALAMEYGFHVSGLMMFLVSAAAIVPLAALLGEATEELAMYLGPSLGGLLNATFGNAGELIIAFFALRAGNLEVVQASLTGSIIGNVLLVFGLSAFVGGLGRETQRFSRTMAGVNASMLMLAVAALVMPAVFAVVVPGQPGGVHPRVEVLSEWTAIVLLLIYGANLVFSLVTHRKLIGAAEHHEPSRLSRNAALGVLTGATALIAWLSEIFVGTIEPAAHALGMSELFVGVIVVAMVGNAAEHAAAIMMARRNQMDLALAISIGSSVQIALLVAPLLVLASYFMGKHMTLLFNPFEIAAVALSVMVVSVISLDGETNWLEGLQMIALYVILAIAFFFVPA